MRTDTTYVILLGDAEDVVGYIRSEGPPSFDAMIDHLTSLCKFNNRYDFIQVYNGVRLGSCALQ
jgi:hypothetical protein